MLHGRKPPQGSCVALGRRLRFTGYHSVLVADRNACASGHDRAVGNTEVNLEPRGCHHKSRPKCYAGAFDPA
ncbi:MAG: hypothetical protein KatS3mg110_1008 [Pirellulaceae bacterium]|nr:MAG: hypothetical protein KatS3mg110_1008 [Pirellulaceae bacterium]